MARKWVQDHRGFRQSKGQEIGLRGRMNSGRLTFLGFLCFLVPEQAPLSSAKCRDGALAEQKNNSTLRFLCSLQKRKFRKDEPVALVRLISAQGQRRIARSRFIVRGFVATGDHCGDLEFLQ